MLRNDGQNAYLLQTANNASLAAAMGATFNAYRPYSWNLTTGVPTIDATGLGLVVGTSGGAGQTMNGGINLVNTVGMCVTINGYAGYDGKIQFQEGGTSRGYVVSNATYPFAVRDSANTINALSLTNAGAGTFASSVTATSFSGSGSGLTGVPNSALVGSGSLTIGSTNVALGGTAATIAGLSLTAPNIGAATGTSLSVTGQLTSTVATGTAPLVVSSSTIIPNLNASLLTGGNWTTPGTIGSTTPNSGIFTTCNATTFTGSGSGLTGTAASLTAGTATTANALNTSNSYTMQKLTATGTASQTSFTGTTNYGGVSVKGSTSTTDYTAIDLFAGGNANPVGRIGVLATSSGSLMYFGTSNSYASGITTAGMNLDYNGNLSVTSSSYPVTLNNTSASSGIIQMQNAGTTHGYIGCDSTHGTYFFNLSGDQNGYFDQSGNLTTIANVSAYSDERVKTNWRDLPVDLLDKLVNLEKVGIYDRTDIDATQAGVSAQQWREILPETVIEDTDGKLSVAYGNAALVTCYALAKENCELKARLDKLEAIIAKLGV